MSIVSCHSVDIKSRPSIRPARGSCRLTLAINGRTYDVRPIPCQAFGAVKAYRLHKAGGPVYAVVQMVHGAECDCPDFVFRRDGLDPAGCKHVRALTVLGLIRQEGGTR
jgi:hypothetical protein